MRDDEMPEVEVGFLGKQALTFRNRFPLCGEAGDHNGADHIFIAGTQDEVPQFLRFLWLRHSSESGDFHRMILREIAQHERAPGLTVPTAHS